MNAISAKPTKEFKVGAVRAAIWENPRYTRDGRSFTSHKVLVDRVYKDVQGSFKTTQSLDVSDIPKAILALKKAYEFCVVSIKKPNLEEKDDAVPFQTPDRLP